VTIAGPLFFLKYAWRHWLCGGRFIRMTSTKRVRATIAAAAIAALGIGGAAFAANANAGTIPLINIMQGTPGGGNSVSGVSGYYGADDAHTHYRYVETIVTASASLNNLNGFATSAIGAAGTELCDENTGHAAQIGLYNAGGKYGVAWAYGTLGANVSGGWGIFDDACTEAGLLAPLTATGPIPTTGVTGGVLLNSIASPIHTGDQILLTIYYNPRGHFGFHSLQFGVTDLSQVNEHRSHTLTIPAESFTEFGIGILSNASAITAPANNLVDTFTNDKVNFYSSTVNAYPITSQKAFYGYGGLSQVEYINNSSQVLISPNSTLVGSPSTASFSVSEGSTTP